MDPNPPYYEKIPVLMSLYKHLPVDMSTDVINHVAHEIKRRTEQHLPSEGVFEFIGDYIHLQYEAEVE